MARRKVLKKQPTQSKSVHIQGRLRRDMVREVSALEVYDHMRDKENMSDREIIRESLIALGQMMHQDWTPQRDVTPVTLTADVLNMLNKMSRLVETLSHMDFTSVRDGNGAPMGEAMQQQLTEFDKSASDLLGKAVFFDLEDDE